MLLSVIVPIYNVEKYLPKCIDSILAQNYSEIEVILVDDGSPDGCPEICDNYAEKDKRIVVIHQKNLGVSAARNAGLKAAHGEYIGFVDPDDWISPSMYQEMITALERENADLAICGYDYYDENGAVDTKRRYKEKADEIITQKELMSRFSDMPPTVRHGVVNKLFRKKLMNGIIFPEKLSSSEDVYFINKYSKKVKKAVVIHKPFYKNLVRQGSATHGGLNIQHLADSLPIHKEMYQNVIQLYPELKNHSLAFFLDVCALKYGVAKKQFLSIPDGEKEDAKKQLKIMKKYIKKYTFQGLFDNEIYWKTRIMYLFL